MACGGLQAINIICAVIVILFWISSSVQGLSRLKKLRLGTSIETNSGKSLEGLAVFNKYLMHRASNLDIMPIVAYVKLKGSSSKKTILGDELRKFSDSVKPLSSCVPSILHCHSEIDKVVPPLFPDCDGICKIPGAHCVWESPIPLSGGYFQQPRYYNSIRAVSGYYFNRTDLGEEIARQRYISADNRSTIVILEPHIPKCSNTDIFYPFADWLSEELNTIFGPSGEYNFGITSWGEMIRSTAQGSLKDTLRSHLITLPIAWFLLYATVGPTAILLIFIMPMSLFTAIWVLESMQAVKTDFNVYSHMAPGIWVSVLIAMSIDYALFFLTRWAEERKQGVSKEFAIFNSMLNAGKTIVVSGMILAISFLSLMMIDIPLVKQIGLSCGTLIIICIIANLTLIPAFLILIPDLEFCYKGSETLKRMRRAFASFLTKKLKKWPVLVTLTRICLSDVDVELATNTGEVATYERLEMKNLTENRVDSPLGRDSMIADPSMNQRSSINPQESLDFQDSLDPRNLLDPRDSLANSRLRLSSSENMHGRSIGDSMDLGESPKNLEEIKAERERVDSEDSDQKIALSPRGAKSLKDNNAKVVQIPKDSIWVQIATVCRKRPIAVILLLLLLGSPLSIQCYRLKLSSSFEQILLSTSGPVTIMNHMRDDGFNAGILNSHFVIVTAGIPEPVNPPPEVQDPSGEEDQQSDGTGFLDAECYGDDGYLGRKRCHQPKCWADDPDGLIKSHASSLNGTRNGTCEELISTAIDYMKKSIGHLSDSTLKEIVCSYDPNADNPAFPEGYQLSYICPVSCGTPCSTKPPVEPVNATLAPTSSPVPAPVYDESFYGLFDCGDDIGNWISKAIPCLFSPLSEYMICDSSPEVMCKIAESALGDFCSRETGFYLGAGGGFTQHSKKTDFTMNFANLCADTCNMCPYKQKIFSTETFSLISALVDEIKRLPVSVGDTSLNTISYMDGNHISYEEALYYLNVTRPDLDEEFHEKGLPTAYRRNVRGKKSMLGSATMITITPRWNSVGAKSADWVYQMNTALNKHEKKGKDKGLDWALYFEGMAPIVAEMKDQMYSSAPSHMSAAIVIVVLLLTAIAFRSLTMGFRLLLTVAFSLSWSFGMMVFLLQDAKVAESQGDGLHFVVPAMIGPVLVGLTLDYDLFLLVRIHEYRLSGFSTQDATMLAMYKTSGIITVAGAIMLAAFSALISSDLFILKTVGMLIVITCILDTFLIRAWLVPAILMVGVEFNWWPGKVPPVTRRCLVA